MGVFLPGGVGIEVLRAYGLARLTADLPLALSSILVERLCGLLALLSMVALGLLLAPIALPGPLQALVVGVALGLLGGALALAHPAPRALLRRLLSQLRLPRAAAAVAGLERRLDAYRSRPRALAWSFLLALAFQGHRVLTVVIGAFALGLPGEALLLVLVVPVAILVGLLPVSLGGLGPREATYVALLGLGGVAPAPALVLALTREVLNLVATLPGAFRRLGGPVAQAAGS